MIEQILEQVLTGNLKGGKAKIIKVEAKKAGDVFGSKARDPNRIVLVVETDKGSRDTYSLPKGLVFENGEYKVVDEIALARSFTNSNSRLRQFYMKYRTLPKPGVEVEIKIDSKGFARIALV